MSNAALAPRPDFLHKLRRFGVVLYAVLLQDMRTRFGGTYLGFLIAIAWPLSHLAGIVIARALIAPLVPMGDNPAVFYGSGVAPYILCLYPARMMTAAITHNKNLLIIPPITPLHLIFGRAALEVLGSILVCLVFYFLLALLGVDFMPVDIYDGALAVATSIYLGIALGFVNVIIVSLAGPFYVVFFYLVMLILFFTSGAYFPVHTLGGMARELVEFNPLFHVVNWFRGAYYVDNSIIEPDRFYILAVATVGIFLGFVGERFLRGKILSA